MASYTSPPWGAPPTDPAQAAAQYSYPGYGAYAGAYPGYEAYYQGYPAEYQQQAPPLPDGSGPEKVPSPPGEEPPGVASSSEHSTQTGAGAGGAPPPPPPGSPTKGSNPAPASASAQPSAQQPAGAPAYDAAAAAAYHQYYSSYYGSAYPYPASAPPPGQHAAAAVYQQPPPVQHIPSYQHPAYQGYNPAYGQQPYGAGQAPASAPTSTPTPTKPASEQPHKQQQQKQQKQPAKSGSYNAVPPPNSLVSTGTNRTPITINLKPQQQAARPGSYAAAASAPAPHTAPTPIPAYVRAPAPTPAAPAPTPPRPAAGSSKFPPSFESWVTRCFESCRTDHEREAMTGRLKSRITEVEGAGRMWLVDWDREAVPTAASSANRSSGAGLDQLSGGLKKRSRWEDPQAQSHYPQDSAHLNQANKKGKANDQQGAGRRGAGKQAQGDDWGAGPNWSGNENRKLQQRAGRFGDGAATGGVQRGARDGGRSRQYAAYDADWDPEDEQAFDPASIIIQGTCQTLEKSYFRLTGAPDPSVVRPPAVLRKALDRLVGLIVRDAVNYFYVCDQLKGMRQDCTVQHLRNELAVAVYEAHARAALEYGDLAEFNQCQTQLASMYADGIHSDCQAEFVAYKLLYNTAHSQSGANKALMHTMRLALQMQRDNAARVPDPAGAITNAMRARTAACTANYPEFFSAYGAAPALGRAILDVLVPRMRWAGLNVLVKTYKTSLPVQFVATVLGFLVPAAAGQTRAAGAQGGAPLPGCRKHVYAGKAAAGQTEAEAVAACAKWLQSCGAVLEAAGTDSPLLDVKASLGKLFIPEEPKVAHGDDKLSVEDFLSRAAASLRAL